MEIIKEMEEILKKIEESDSKGEEILISFLKEKIHQVNNSYDYYGYLVIKSFILGYKTALLFLSRRENEA